MAKATRNEVLTSIANTIADYRQGEIATLDAEHVDRWIRQFEAPVQEPMLAELDHVLKKTFVTRTEVEQYLCGLATAQKLAGDDPCDFWKTVNFLNIQGGGNSQREMLAMFETALQRTCGLKLRDCGLDDGPYVYLDDAIFTGNRIRSDLTGWLESSAPATAKVHVVVIAFHRGGQYYAESEIHSVADAVGKTVSVTWWRCVEIENRKSKAANSDVLWPATVPALGAVQDYVQQALRDYPLILRSGNSVGENAFFSSGPGRNLIEQELLKAGAYIRTICPHLNQYQRPLGNIVLQTLGFGALLVTFRNCANNCPLAFWASDPWYPLFPRKTN